MAKEIEIPEGYEAKIENNKVIFVPKETEDERIRQMLISIVECACSKYGIKYIGNEISEEKLLAYLEKQKDANKAIEAVDRIDKFIDENVANAHDMKDSNPDKKYYSGWDNALGEMARILQDVYSDEKQKEQKSTVEKLREISTPADENWFEIQKKWENENEQKPADKNDIVNAILSALASGLDTDEILKVRGFTYDDVEKFLLSIRDEQKPVECLKVERDGWYVCIKDYHCGGKKQCSVGDLVQAKGGMYMMGEEDISEWFRRAYYEDVRDAFAPNTDMNIPEKPAEWSDSVAKEMFIKALERAVEQTKKGYELTDCDKHSWWEDFKAYSGIKPAEWSEEDERMLSRCVKSIESSKQFVDTDTFKKAKDNEIDWLKNRFKFLGLQPKQEWSEEDEENLGKLHRLLVICQGEKKFIPTSEYDKLDNWLKSLRPPFKDREMKLKILKYLSTRCSSLEFEEVEEYLNNLRPHWKPSEE